MGDVVKMFLIVTIFFSIGVLVLPSTVSLFAGQHVWYDISGAVIGEGDRWESNIECIKCHADVADEMEAIIGPHTGETGEKLLCSDCHRINKTYEFAAHHKDQAGGGEYIGGEYIQPGKIAHAARVPACMDCHKFRGHHFHQQNEHYHPYTYYNGAEDATPGFDDDESCGCHDPSNPACKRCHGDSEAPEPIPDVPSAGGFGLTYVNLTARYEEDTGINASHYSFVMRAINNQTLTDANEACIACHTKIKLRINFNVTTEAKIVVNNSYTTASSYWDVADISPSNYTTYEEVKG